MVQYTANGTSNPPVPELNTLANILSGCVNSNGTGAACSGLMSAATPPGGPAPVDTLQAAINIARYPGNNVGVLFGLESASPAFLPALSAAPNDWTVQVTHGAPPFTIDHYFAPGQVAIDSLGNMWMLSSGTPGLYKMSNLGQEIYDLDFTPPVTGGLNMAVDSLNDLWLVTASHNVAELTSTGSVVSASVVPTASFGGPISIDGSGYLWGVNSTGSGLIKFSSSGTLVSPATGYPASFLYNSVTATHSLLSIDAAGDVWGANVGQSGVTEVRTDGTLLSPSGGFTGGGISTPSTTAIDSVGNVWALNQYSAEIAVLSAVNGSPVSTSSGYAITPCVAMPNDVLAAAVDGAGNMWIISACGGPGSTTASAVVTVLNASGVAVTPAAGYIIAPGYSFTSSINNVAIDSSGNVWLPEPVDGLVEMVGAAAPVMTPISAALAAGKIGVKP